MIVKDESAVIRRCLESVRELIDYWVIADTGSSDDTREIVKDCLKKIPGELHERPWVNFAHNRNETLQLSKGKGDYVLFIDADERAELSKTFFLPVLDRDYYSAVHRSNETDFLRVLLINNRLNWKWVGAIHETPECPEAKTSQKLSGITVICTQDGSRSQDPEKFYKDIRILENALAIEPENGRNTFYLAQTYEIVSNFADSMKMYQKRKAMGPPNQEVFWSAYQIGRLQEQMNYPPDAFIQSYCEAYLIRPTRAEPLFHLANHYIRIKNFYLSYLVSKDAALLHLSQDALYVERWIYEWGVLLQFANSAQQIGRREEANKTYRKLLEIPSFPAEYHSQIREALLR